MDVEKQIKSNQKRCKGNVENTVLSTILNRYEFLNS